MAKLLDIQDLRTQFRTSAGVVKAVDGISYDVEEGETVAIVGESGCGKSVGAMSILRLIPDPPGRIVGGVINFQGRNLLDLEDEEIRQGLKDYSNWPTFPQLYVKGELIGGSDIVVEMYHSGELKTLLEKVDE